MYGTTPMPVRSAPTRTRVRRVLVVEDNVTGLSWIGNLAWILFGGGAAICVVYAVFGLLLCATIVLFPFGIQLLKLAAFSLFPFGKTVQGPGCCDFSGISIINLLANLLWFPIGLVIFFLHTISALVCLCSVIGIPFTFQHIKLAQFALMPFGSYDDGGMSVYEYTTITAFRDPANIHTRIPTQSFQTALPVAQPLMADSINSTSSATSTGASYQYNPINPNQQEFHVKIDK